MSDKNVFRMNGNELIQSGAVVKLDISAGTGKEKIGITVDTVFKVFCWEYYAVAEKAADVDVECTINLVSLFYKPVTVTIKKGATRSADCATTIGIKIANLSSVKPAAESRYDYFYGATRPLCSLDRALAENVLYDYKGGVTESVMTADCADYEVIGGGEPVDWSGRGEIIVPDDIVCDEDSGAYFKVTGRTFTKEGAPFQKLEIKQIYKE